jgi:hypothetical protein
MFDGIAEPVRDIRSAVAGGFKKRKSFQVPGILAF